MDAVNLRECDFRLVLVPSCDTYSFFHITYSVLMCMVGTSTLISLVVILHRVSVVVRTSTLKTTLLVDLALNVDLNTIIRFYSSWWVFVGVWNEGIA